jgi:histidine triad (HIT) family protein
MEDCIFCKIIKGEILSYKVYENEKVLVILDINPANEGHLLIIPKKHFENIFDIEEDYLVEVIKVAKKLSMLFIEYDGLNLLQNNKEQAGQIVKHFHLHLIPRIKGDENRIVMKWVPKQLSKEDFETIAEELKNYINKVFE